MEEGTRDRADEDDHHAATGADEPDDQSDLGDVDGAEDEDGGGPDVEPNSPLSALDDFRVAGEARQELRPEDVQDQGEDGPEADQHEAPGHGEHAVVVRKVVEEVVLDAVFGQRERDVDAKPDQEVGEHHQRVPDAQVPDVILLAPVVPHDGDDGVVNEQPQGQGAGQAVERVLEQGRVMDGGGVPDVDVGAPAAPQSDGQAHQEEHVDRAHEVVLREGRDVSEAARDEQRNRHVNRHGGVAPPVDLGPIFNDRVQAEVGLVRGVRAYRLHVELGPITRFNDICSDEQYSVMLT